MKFREDLGKMIQKITTVPLPNTSVMPLIDYEVNMARMSNLSKGSYLCRRHMNEDVSCRYGFVYGSEIESG